WGATIATKAAFPDRPGRGSASDLNTQAADVTYGEGVPSVGYPTKAGIAISIRGHPPTDESRRSTHRRNVRVSAGLQSSRHLARILELPFFVVVTPPSSPWLCRYPSWWR